MAGPAPADLTIYQGDDYALVLHFWTDEAHTIPADVSDRVFRCELRPSPGHADLLVAMTVQMADADEGEVAFTLTAAQTAALARDCSYDVEQEVEGMVTTIFRGDVEVVKQVTRAAV